MGRSVVRAMLWVGGFALAGWGLWRLGELEWLRVDWSDPWGWMAGADPETALAALARLVGLAIVGWVFLSTLVYIGARLAGADIGSIDWLSIGPIRKSIDALLAGSLVVSTMAPAGAAVDPPGSAPPPVSSEVEQVDPAYVPIPAGWPDGTIAEEIEPSAPALTETTEPDVVVVESGDNLWAIAERHLARVWDRAPSDGEIAPYWVELIEANRDGIRSGDPDLIFPGERIVLPPLNPGS